METVSQEVIDSIWEEALDTPEEDAQQRFEELFEPQPALAAYLVYLEEELMPPDERGVILLIGYCVVKAMLHGGKKVPMVTPEELEAAERKNVDMMENLEGGELDWMNQGVAFIKSYPQAPLLSTVLETLMEDNEEAPETTKNDIAVVWLSIKAIIDCLDR